MLKFGHHLLLVLGALLLCTGPAWGGASEQLFNFAETLYAEQDYYRAITEYKRFLHQTPEANTAPLAALRIGQSLLAGERWSESEVALQRVLFDYPQSTAANQAALLLPEVSFRQQRFSLASEQFRQLAESAEHLQTRAQARYRLAWAEIEQHDFNSAISELHKLESPQAESLAAALASRQPLPEKSPGLAGALSALLPGTGQIYTGHYRDAGLAFTLNVAFIWAALEAFDNNNEVLGGILGFFEIGWYGGNIYNAVNHAQRTNQTLYNQEKMELQERFGIQLKLGPDTGLLEFHGRF